MRDWIVTRDGVGEGLPSLNLNTEHTFVEDEGGFLLIGQEYDVQTEGRPWMHHEVDVSRRRKPSPWTFRVHVKGASQAECVEYAQVLIAALFRQEGEFSITVTENGLSYPYGCRARKWDPVLDDEARWWSKGRLAIAFTVQARLLPGHPLVA